MNKKALIILWVALGLAPLCGGAEVPTLPPLTEPILSRLSDYAAWTETFKSKAKAPAPAAGPIQGAAPSPQELRTIKEIRTIKGPQNRRTIKQWSDGLTTESWVVGGSVLQEEPGQPDIYIFTEATRAASSITLGDDYSKTDFPELSWLSVQNYSGVRSYQGRSCYVFEMKELDTSSPGTNKMLEDMKMVKKVPLPGENAEASPTPLPTPAVPKKEIIVKTAWIDGKTRLPVAVEDQACLQTYLFGTAPADEPQLPPRFKSALEKYEQIARGPFPRSN
jgi:hypothetical protein